MKDASAGFWVFGYGSLMWRPGFDFAERKKAVLSGYARRFCLLSVRYRGTADAPGLVLALDHDAQAQCHGVAFRIAPENGEAVLKYLREREMITGSYHETMVALRLEDGAEALALTYVINRHHPQYAGALSLDEQAAMIARSCGGAGPNCEYLFNTSEMLHALDAPDAQIDALCDRVRALRNDEGAT